MATPQPSMAAHSAPAPAAADAQSPNPAETPNQHEREAEEREAFQYWGYLFKQDKTGSDKLKSVLSGLKDHMNASYEPSDNPDLTPTQLAHFYRDLNGNYDQLFLGTPSDSIGFIYKSLGCVHSLQPLPHSTAFTDPTVPALKTEGWIMWQTIQLLLGPEEHSSFLIEALQRWDITDSATGEAFPKTLPRRCFPMEPDKHMVAWYEGVSERLRKEAEDEERQRQIEAEQAEVRRLHDRRRDDHTDDESSVDSRGPALAYFRNPLYRHVDGRPTIVRRNSKRPALSPRPTSMMDKGKDAASSVGHVIRNIGSPHLWDGRKTSKSHSRERDRDRRRRSSFPDNRYNAPGDAAPHAAYDARPSPDRRPSSVHHRRRTPTENQIEDYDADDSGAYSPRPNSRTSRQHHHHNDDYDPALRHSKSHEPTPSQREYGDYFEGYDHDPNRPSPGAQQPTSSSNSNTNTNTMGPSFGPSASPLFASHVAKQPQPQRPTSENFTPSRMPPSVRRAQNERPYSRSPDPSGRSRARDDRYQPPGRDPQQRYDSPRRSQYGGSGGGRYDDNGPPPSSSGGYGGSHGPPPMGAYHHTQPGFPPVGAPITAPPGPYAPGGGPRDRRGHRASSSDVSGPDDRDRGDRRGGGGGGGGPSSSAGGGGGGGSGGSGPPQKQTRFAAGVDGRRYPNESAWRS